LLTAGREVQPARHAGLLQVSSSPRLLGPGQLKGALYYNWQGFIHALKEDLASAFRCGTLTASGRLAIAPL
jgi:hypothetical protein